MGVWVGLDELILVRDRRRLRATIVEQNVRCLSASVRLFEAVDECLSALLDQDDLLDFERTILDLVGLHEDFDFIRDGHVFTEQNRKDNRVGCLRLQFVLS